MTTVAHGHDHACASKLAGVLTADVAGDTDPQGNLVDPDGCGHCHCPVPTTDLPKPALLVAGITMIDLEHRLADMRVPDGLRLQPDPPPVRG